MMRESTALAVLLLVVAASVNAVRRGGGVLQADLAALDTALADLETDVVDTTVSLLADTGEDGGDPGGGVTDGGGAGGQGTAFPGG